MKSDQSKLEFIINNYKNMTNVEMSKYLKVSPKTIFNYLKKNNIIRDKNEKGKQLLENNIQNAHFWGLIMSDGHIARNTYSIHIQLKNHDETYLNIISNQYNYSTRLKNNYVYLNIHDKINNKLLKEKLQISHIKTYEPPKDLSFLNNKEELLAFVVGFIDGDGCIEFKFKKLGDNYNKKSITITVHKNWYNIFNIIKNELYLHFDINAKIYLYEKRNKCSFIITKREDILKLKKEVDKLNINYMKRKWNQIDEEKWNKVNWQE